MNAHAQPRFPGKAEIPALLRRHGITPTRQRVQVAEVLLSRPQHVTADQLLHLVNGEYPAVSRATIYNTLGAFVRAGLLGVVKIPGDTVYYDSSTHDHAHVYNEDTGEVFDAPVDVLRLAAGVPLPEGLELAGADFLVRVRNTASD